MGLITSFARLDGDNFNMVFVKKLHFTVGAMPSARKIMYNSQSMKVFIETIHGYDAFT